jgi:hypothetical protein
MTPSGTRDVLNDALYFGDAALASAFVARWCVAAKAQTPVGVFQVREVSWRRGSGPGRIGRRGRLRSVRRRRVLASVHAKLSLLLILMAKLLPRWPTKVRGTTAQ